MTRRTTLFLVCAFEIGLILFVAAWSAWGADLEGHEYFCIPKHKVVSSRDNGFQNLPLKKRIISVGKQFVYLEDEIFDEPVKLFRDCTSCGNILASGDALTSKPDDPSRRAFYTLILAQNSKNFEISYQLTWNVGNIKAEYGKCNKK